MLALVTRARFRCPRVSPFPSWSHAVKWDSYRAGRRAISIPTPVGTQQNAELDKIRNIGIIAHVDAGKTTTTEAMLYNSGAIRHLGNVDTGDTVTDFLEMERKRGITIQSAAITFKWPTKERMKQSQTEHTVNLVDTPGHVDFRFEVERCIPIIDGAVCVIDGVEGVEAHTERVWSSAQEFKVPRIVLVNKLDRVGASFKKSIQDIGLKLHGMPLVCQIPWWDGDNIRGVVDVITRSVVSWGGAVKDDIVEMANKIPSPAFQKEIELAREKVIELLCDHDEELLELWTEQGKDLPAETIKKSIRKVINNGEASLIPILAGSSLKNIGVISLLDAVNDYLPSPRDRPELQVRVGSKMQSLAETLDASRNTKVPVKQRSPIEALASVFKVVSDPKRGVLTFVRVYHGTLKRNALLWNSNLQEFERAINITHISANQHIEIPQLSAGQIGAIAGLKKARTGDTLLIYAGNKAPTGQMGDVKVRPPDIPPAVAFVVLEPYSPTGAKAIEGALGSISREDPSLRWSLNEKTEQYVLSGMGQLHLEVAKDRLLNHYKVEAHWGGIEVEYKECVTAPTGTHRVVVDKTIAGKSGKAACSGMLEPLEPSETHSIAESDVERDGNIFRIDLPDNIDEAEEFRRQLLNGAIAATARGPRRSSPLNQCLITIAIDPDTDYFGSAPAGHLFNASYQAVKTALKEAHKNGIIGILEPMMSVTLTCPDVAAQTVQHDLQSVRGGQVIEVRGMEGTVPESSRIDISEIYAPPDPYEFQTTLRETRRVLRMLEIIARVPLGEMLDYDAHMRRMTQGRHSMTMSLDTFERVTGQREKNL